MNIFTDPVCLQMIAVFAGSLAGAGFLIVYLFDRFDRWEANHG